MGLLDRIFGLTSEYQEQVDKFVAIVEENEELKKVNERLEEQVAELKEDIMMLSEELDMEKQKARNIEQIIENSIAQIKDMK